MTDPRTSVDVAAMRASDVADLVRQERLLTMPVTLTDSPALVERDLLG